MVFLKTTNFYHNRVCKKYLKLQITKEEQIKDIFLASTLLLTADLDYFIDESLDWQELINTII